MDGFKDNIDNLSNTSNIEEFLIAAAYWIAIIFVILFVFYVSVKLNNFIQDRKRKKSRGGDNKKKKDTNTSIKL